MVPPPSDELPEASYSGGRKAAAGLVAAASLLVGAGWTFLRYRPSRVTIEGPSMAPTLLPGDWALVVAPRAYDRGVVVVVEHPGRPGYELVKRLTGVPGDMVADRLLADDEHWVEGDYPQASTDSRHFGPVTREELKAKVVLVYWPRERRRMVR